MFDVVFGEELASTQHSIEGETLDVLLHRATADAEPCGNLIQCKKLIHEIALLFGEQNANAAPTVSSAAP